MGRETPHRHVALNKDVLGMWAEGGLERITGNLFFLALWSWVAEAWVDRKLCFSEVWVKMQDIFTYCKIDNTFFWSPLVWNYFKQKPEKIHSYAHMEWLLIWRTLFIKAKQISYNSINIFFNFRNSFLCSDTFPCHFSRNHKVPSIWTGTKLSCRTWWLCPYYCTTFMCKFSSQTENSTH